MQQQTIASFLTSELASQITELLKHENELFEFIAQVINSKEEKYITKLRSTLQNWQNGVKSILEMDVFNINNLRSDGTRNYFIALCNAFNIYVPKPLRAPHIYFKLETVSSIDCNGIFQQLKKKIGKKYNLNNLTDDKLDQIVAKCHPFRNEVVSLLWKDFTEVKNLDNEQLQNISNELYSWESKLCNFILAPDLNKYIDSYIRKPLSQRKIDPLRFLISQVCSKDMFAIFDQDSSQAKREFFKLIEKNSELKNVKDQQKVFYVLLELFDRERIGNDSRGYYHFNFRPLYSLTQSERNEVKIWYKKNMPDTDLFDDLEIENEEDKEQDEQESNINIIENNIYNSDPNSKDIDKQSRKINTSDIIKNNLGESSSSYVDTNEISFNRSKKTIKKSKTSNLGYKIGLVLDILATAIFIYLAITISLYFLITLAITVPIGIFFGLRLCQGCLIFGDNKIKTFDFDNNDGHFYSETREPENELKHDQKHDLENDQ